MGLRLTPPLEDAFRALYEAGAEGIGDPEVTNLPIFEENLLAEQYRDDSRVMSTRYRLTPVGQRMADFLFGRNQNANLE
jgi:hypothetical protein